MNRLLYTFFICLFTGLTVTTETKACGYSFIGACSSNIHLRINNTLDSFNLAACFGGTNLDGLDLGAIKTLTINKAGAITWESCDNNVTDMKLYYRIRQQGTAGGAWSALTLGLHHSDFADPYLTRYFSKFSNIDLMAGLAAGEAYILETFYQAAVDTLGNDNIPETNLIQNNNGAYFKLKFVYAGNSAPPFTVVTTKKVNVSCFGGKNGTVGVTVYGNQDNLFYAWSYMTQNFNVLFNLPAGTYMVTVSGVNGYAQADTVTIAQPAALNASFSNIQPVICGTTDGSATIQASGGTAPWQYAWVTGQTTATAQIPSAGIWQVTVTDAKVCTKEFSVAVPGDSIVKLPMSGKICKGETFKVGTHEFTEGGNYQFILNQQPGCDTLVELQLTQYDPTAAFQGLPVEAQLTCNSVGVTLCGQNLPGFVYTWTKNGVMLGSGPCIIAGSGGLYQLTASTGGCTASYSVNVKDSGGALALTFLVSQAATPNTPNGAVQVFPNGGTGPYIGLWNTGQTGLAIEGLLPGEYCVTVADATGCTGNSCAVVSATSASYAPKAGMLKIRPNPTTANGGAWVEFPEITGEKIIHFELVSIEGEIVKRNTATPVDGQFYMDLSGLAQGLYYVKVLARDRTGMVKLLLTE